MNIDVKKFVCMTIISLTVLTSFSNDTAPRRRFGDNDCIMVTKKIKAHKGMFNRLCADNIKSKKICTDDLSVNNAVNFDSLCVNNLCINDVLRMKEICGLYRATAVIAADFTYTLGTPVNFNAIVDDPNNNVSLSPFDYTVPVSGYYDLTVQIDCDGLAGTALILGTPISVVEVYVNGVLVRQDYRPFLAFHNEQRSTFSGLISLLAGDTVTVRYNVLVLNDTLGSVNYVGTVNLLGNGSESNSMLFKIHYLSSNCTPAGCGPCTPIPCDNTCIDTCRPCND